MGARPWLARATAALCLLTTACAGREMPAPSQLYDGTPPERAPAQLRSLGPVVLGRSRPLARGAPALQRCAGRFPGLGTQPRSGVARRGVDGGSVTFAVGPLVFGCDSAAGAREPPAWGCGGAAGKRRAGALADARLGLANCIDRSGRAVAFAWVEPAVNSRWLAVERGGWRELYEVDPALPVRVATTTGIDERKGVVRLEVRHVSAAGRELRRDELQLRVAG